jgi:hypothetical protein
MKSNQILEIIKHPTKPNWHLLMEGEIVKAAGSVSHCEHYKRQIERYDAAQTHTPEPYRLETDGQEVYIVDATGLERVATMTVSSRGQRLRDAAHICAACNSHAALLAAFKAAAERMEAVAEKIPVENRHESISQARHVRHMAGHLAQHAKIARAAIAATEKGGAA